MRSENKLYKYGGLVFILIIIGFSFPSQYYFEGLNSQNNDLKIPNSLNTSDIAGSDLYAENINAFVAGNNSLIKQSIFTNDTSILPHFNTQDPAFYKCNILISASNGINPRIFPRILTEEGYNNQYTISFNGFSGFLYYDEDLPTESVQIRAERALEIIRRKFNMDLIMINISSSYFFPFIGYYPNWGVFLQEMTGNLPMDGYWKAFDINRLSSEEYYNSHHLSSTFLLVNSLDLLDFDLIYSLDQVNFNLDSLDLSYLETLEVDNIFEQFSSILTDYSSLFGNASDLFGLNQTSQEDFTGAFSGLTLSNESHYASMMIQYEGLETGITKISQNEYEFDLWRSMGYYGEPLLPSEKIFIALIGAFMTGININIFCTEIIDNTPKYFTLYEFLLEQLGTLLFYAGIDFDIQTLKDYSFELLWVDNNGFKRNIVNPINLEDPTDYINFLRQLGFQGIPGIPTGLFNPIDNLNIRYKISTSEPNLIITKSIVEDNATFGVYKNFSFNITTRNTGNQTAWGVPTPIPIELDDAFSLIVGPIGTVLGLDQDLKNDIWDVVRVEYSGQYTSIEDFFNYDEDPRLFYFDTTGSGLYDTYFPNLSNLTNLYPYNKDMDNVIDIIEAGNPQLISGLLTLGLSPEELTDIFTNNNSIWNEENWKLEPNEQISYLLNNFSIENYDSFTPFYRNNFTIKESFPQLPSIITGVSVNETTPYMALSTDDKNWVIESEEKFIDQHEIEIQFLFSNESDIDLETNELDMVSVIINYSDPENILIFEIFNYTSEEFQDISQYLSTSVNSTSTFSFIKNQGSFDWLFGSAPEDYSVIFRIRGENINKFNVSINDLDIEFSYRDINEYKVLDSRVIYSSESGNIEYERISNTLSLSTLDMASIVAFSYVSKYSAQTGEINNYTLKIKNIGSEIASNINISILIPGIIYDRLNFTMHDNLLDLKLFSLSPFEEKEFSFSFYTPNSGIISNVNITYMNLDYIKNLNSSILESKPNLVYISAPVDYENRFPFVKIVDFSLSASNMNPEIGDEINMSIHIKNTGIIGLPISNLSISIDDYYGDLERIDSGIIVVDNLDYLQSKSYNITLFKHDWKGYFYPPINYLSSSEDRLIQIGNSGYLSLGNISFSIHKSVNKNQVEIGQYIRVSISITNTGTICVKDVYLDDTKSFLDIDFRLVNGSLLSKINCLKPGQNATIYFTIQAITQIVVKLDPAIIEYFFLTQQIAYSNNIQVKVIIPKNIQYLFVIGSSSTAFIVLIIFLWQTRKYKSKKYEIRRYESLLFTGSSSESVLKIEKTLKEELKSMQNQKPRVLTEIPRESENSKGDDGSL